MTNYKSKIKLSKIHSFNQKQRLGLSKNNNYLKIVITKNLTKKANYKDNMTKSTLINKFYDHDIKNYYIYIF